jgi:hypothetical protein
MAFQIDGDINAEPEQKLGHFSVAAQCDVVELIKRPDQAAARLACVVDAVGHAQYLKPGPIVQPEQLGRKPSRRMVSEIRREIGEPNLFPNAGFLHLQQARYRRQLVTHEPACVLQLLRGREGICEQREWLDHRPFVVERPLELELELSGFVPIAQHQPIESQRAECVRVSRIDRQHPFPRRRGLLVPGEICECVATVIERFRVVGLERKRALELGERVLEPVHRQQRGPPIVQHADIRGVDRQSAIERCQRLCEPSQLRKRKTAVVERFHIMRVDRRSALETRQCVLVPRELGQGISVRDPGRDGIGVDPQCPFTARDRFFVPAENPERDAAVAQGVGIVGPQRQQLVVTGKRFRMPPELHKGVSTICKRADMPRGLTEDCLVGGNGFAEAGQCGEGVTALEQRVDRAAVARQNLAEGDERVIESPQPRQHHGAIVERVEAAPIDRDQPVASSQRFFEPSHREQRRHEDRQGLRRPGAKLDGLAQQIMGFSGAAPLIENEAQQMEGIELARIAGKHGTIDGLRLRNPTGLMQCLSLLDRRHRQIAGLTS